jgi:hypothetical protein
LATIILASLPKNSFTVNSDLKTRWYKGNLTFILLTWRIWLALNNASNWQMGFNSVFKGLISLSKYFILLLYRHRRKNLKFGNLMIVKHFIPAE